MISEEDLENDEIMFQNVYGHSKSVELRIRGILVTHCVSDFLFYGNPCMKKENVMLCCRETYGIRPTGKGHTSLSNLQV